MSHDFAKLAEEAAERKARLLSFGPHAFGLVAQTEDGLFVVDAEDRWVGGTLLNYGSFADHEYLLARSLITTDSKVLIVGSHIGTHVVRLSRHCQALTAIEANPATFNLLRLNVLLNECRNVTVHNIAASDKFEKITFLMNRENSGGSKRMPSVPHYHYVYDNPNSVEIDAAPLDSYLNGDQFDLVFMDIEGSEYFALRGMQKILASCKALSIEFFPHHIMDVAGVGIDEFSSVFTPHFEWMYVPGREELFPGPDMARQLRTMFDAGEGHEGIYFLKALSVEWLQLRGLTAPE
jgi:FkbM family methyltransferase